MLKNMRLMLTAFGVVAVGLGGNADAAVKKTTTAKQAAIQKGTSVRTRVDASGLYDQACYDAYYGCMDQFCIPDNANGGSCTCSDDSAAYEKEFAEIQKILEEAARISTVEVEKVKAGAQADIIFTGTREYDEDGNLKEVDELVNGSPPKKFAANRFRNHVTRTCHFCGRYMPVR